MVASPPFAATVAAGPSRSTDRQRGSGARRPGQDLTAWWFLIPSVLVLGLAVIAPLGYAVWISFFDWDGLTPARWVGPGNYLEALSDPAIHTAAGHSLLLLVFYSVLPIAIGLVFAAVIARQRLRLTALWRTILFLPQVLSVVVVGVAWQWILAKDGPLNRLLNAVGLDGFTRAWLGDFDWALPAQGAIGTWMMTGLCMVLLLAGAQTIDPNLYDAAGMDGAGPIRQFFHVTVPGLRNVVVVCTVLTAAASLNNFGLVWVTTRGGPGDATQVLSTAIYSRAFIRSELGMASALAVLVLLVMMVLAVVLARRTEDA